MTDIQALGRARKSFVRRVWAESYRLFQDADSEVPLEPEDLERLATAAYLIGRDAESETFRARAHQTFLDRGDREGAARSASWLGFGLLQRGAIAPASGWFARAERILDEAHLDCVVRGYLLIPSAIQRIVQGDPVAGHAAFTQAAEIARRFGDRDLASLACHGRGRALIRLGNIADGVALLDEAMVAVIAGDVTPILAGDVYCSVLEGCQETFDLRRAYEWTLSLAEWCAAQADLVRYRGECLLYRAEVMQLRGKWTDAAQDAQDACELLASRPAAGAARLTVKTAIGRKLRDHFLDPPRGIPLGRVRRKDFAAAGIERVPRMIGVRNGYPVLEDGRVLKVSNVIWCTGFTPNYDWIDLALPTHNGFPSHDRGIVESCSGLYFVGLPFLYSLSSALVGGVGRDAEHIVNRIASTRLARRPEGCRQIAHT